MLEKIGFRRNGEDRLYLLGDFFAGTCIQVRSRVSGDEMFTGKYPAETGQVENLDMKVVAGHVGTAEIAGDPGFHDIYYDGASHYYIDGTVLESGRIPALKVDTETDKYYRVTEGGDWLILPYDEED